jgi:hypothetical protein
MPAASSSMVTAPQPMPNRTVDSVRRASLSDSAAAIASPTHGEGALEFVADCEGGRVDRVLRQRSREARR